MALLNSVREVSTGEVLGGLALAGLVVKEAFSFVRQYLGKNSSTSANGRAGDKPVSFWKEELYDAHVKASNETVVPILNGIAKTNEKIARLLDGLVNRSEK